MKKARIIIRIISWVCLILGLGLLIYWAILERWPGLVISYLSWMDIETTFWTGALVGFFGLLVLMVVEDQANWDSICKWIEKRKSRK